MDKSKLVGKIQVDNSDVKDLIVDNINQLKKSLEKNGIDIQRFDVFTREETNNYFNNNNREMVSYNNRRFYNSGGFRRHFVSENPDNGDYKSGLRYFGYNTVEFVI